MTRPTLTFAFAAIGLALLTFSAPVLAQDAASPPAGGGAAPPKAASAVAPAEEEETGGLQAAKFMPLGKPNLKVKIPQFKDGVLECVMRADKMTRVDEINIDIETMDIDFLEDGAPSMSIELQDANYSLDERLLSSEKRAVVKRADFTLVGDSLEFDTVERRGRMSGKVRMVIHDSKTIAAKDEKEDEAEEDDVPADKPEGPWVARVAGEIAAAVTEKAETDEDETNSNGEGATDGE